MRHLRFLPVVAALTALGLLPLAGCGWADSDRISSDFHATVAHAPANLEVDNEVGAIEIDAWGEPSIEINATKRGPSYDVVNAIKITVTSNAHTVTVNTQFPSGSTNSKVEYTIHAPAAIALRLTQSVGAIKSTGFTGDVDERTSTGAIESTLGALGGTQHVRLEVNVGAIKVSLPASADAAVTASTSVGAIKSDFPLSITRTMVGQNAQGKIGGGSAVADFTVSTGAIAIQRE
ncbi:MAG TPA: hypothetical protein VF741_04140 [Candidatus Aquilonibacter sp.]